MKYFSTRRLSLLTQKS